MPIEFKPRRWYSPLVCHLFGHLRMSRYPVIMCRRCWVSLDDKRKRTEPMERNPWGRVKV